MWVHFGVTDVCLKDAAGGCGGDGAGGDMTVGWSRIWNHNGGLI